MICLISCLNRQAPVRWLLALLLGSLFLSGCAGLGGESKTDRIELLNPPLVTVKVQRSSPQMVGTDAVNWSASASADLDEVLLIFEMREDRGAPVVVQYGVSSTWSWLPETAGRFQVRVTSVTESGARTEGPWSKPFEIVPTLVVSQLSSDRSSPQAALTNLVIWSVSADGGDSGLTYRFELEKNGVLQTSTSTAKSSSWQWNPNQPGEYRVRAKVTDRMGNAAQSNWSDPFHISPPLVINRLMANQPTPQMVLTSPVIWTAAASGGVGEITLAFEFGQLGEREKIVQSGSAASWIWQPDQAGEYRIRAIATDDLENRSVSPWYGPFQITPPLTVKAPITGKPSPQAAQSKPIDWMAVASGGVAPLNYQFEIEQDGQLLAPIATGIEHGWAWQPDLAGSYRVRVQVIDARGNQVKSAWSKTFEIVPPLAISTPTTAVASPQMLATVDIPWSVQASGGVGVPRIVFELSRKGSVSVLPQRGVDSTWTWQPELPGEYRVRAILTDERDNRLESDWSEAYLIVGPLMIESLVSDRPAPQAAQTVPIRWILQSTGGVGPKAYAFELSSDREAERFVQQGRKNSWQWQPETAGHYRIRATVTDALGNRVQRDWTKTYEVMPPLLVSTPETSDTAKQYLVRTKIRWQIQSSGGVGNKTFTFKLERQDGGVETVQTSAASFWTWRPETAGVYRVQVLVVDAIGNQRQSVWSDWKVIRLPLSITGLVPSVASPQPALRDKIRWSVKTTGGVGDLTYEFRSKKDGIELIEQRSPAASWTWNHSKTGSYQVKVKVWDATQKSVESDWSDVYRIIPAINPNALIAVLPVENLTGRKVPLREISAAYVDFLQRKGMQLLSTDRLEKFMHKHRMRYTGGISSVLSEALRDEEGVEAVIITSLESYTDERTPQFALTSRLVVCQDEPRIGWVDGVGLMGDDDPGLLILKRISLVTTLQEIAFAKLWSSLENYLAGSSENRSQSSERLEPREYYRATEFNPESPYKIAIVPFLNSYARRNAGFVVPLHLLHALSLNENLEVVEPGLVREQLLKYRLIMQAGPSLAVADVLSSPATLEADLILSGYVFDYQDAVGTPKIDFSTRLFYGPERKIVWWSRSYGTGSDGVYFYDVGRIWSTHNMMQQMSYAISALLFSQQQ